MCTFCFFVLVCALFVPFKNSFTDFKNLKKVALNFCMWDSDLSMKADHHFLSVFALSQLPELSVCTTEMLRTSVTSKIPQAFCSNNWTKIILNWGVRTSHENR